MNKVVMIACAVVFAAVGWFGNQVVSPAIMRVQGVGASSVQDERLAIRIWLDSDRMAAQGIGTEEVVAAVRSQNVQASLGTVGAQAWARVTTGGRRIWYNSPDASEIRFG